ncbi:hypothetical protein CDD83_8415 [Cordyceps sp. RAO-2017]|nr:hypothetical protein CDD83_8415 [Cordyceps sp. RAO-2017]
MDDRGEYSSGMKKGIPQSHLRLAANLPLAEEAIGRSFICEAELAAILKGDEGNLGNDLWVTKHRKFSSVLDDSISTAWKTSSYGDGPLCIMRNERLIPEQKFQVAFDASFKSFQNIQNRLHDRGWDLEYSSYLHIKSKVPTERRCFTVPPAFAAKSRLILGIIHKEIDTNDGEARIDD